MSYQRSCCAAAAALLLSVAITGCKPTMPEQSHVGTKTPKQTPAAAPLNPPNHAKLPPGDPDSAAMAFSEVFHDFGSVLDTSDVTHAFEFVNNGGKKLKIKSLKTSCGCTKAEASAMEIAPGATGTINVTYDPRGQGQHTYRVNIATNAGPQELQIRATVDPFVALEPRRITFDKLELNKKHEADITLVCKDPNMTLESVRVRNDHVTATPVGSTKVRVEIAEDAPWGELKDTIVIVAKGTPPGSSEQIEHTLYVPMSASIFGEVHASPSTYRLGVIKPGATFEKSVELTRATGAPLDVLAAEVQESNLPGVRVRVQRDDIEPNRVKLVLEGDIEGHKGPVHGVVAFKTSATGNRKSRLRFSGIVR